jgi:hypothetical protein
MPLGGCNGNNEPAILLSNEKLSRNVAGTIVFSFLPLFFLLLPLSPP